MDNTFSGSSAVEWCWIEDPVQAHTILRSRTSRLFHALLARTRTATQLTAELQLSHETLHHQLQKLLRLGLIHVVQLEHRPGRSIKHYRTVADAYYIPFEVTPYAGAYEMVLDLQKTSMERVARGMTHLMEEQGQRSRRIYRDPETGEVHTVGAPDPRMPPPEPAEFLGLDFSLEVHLTAEEARTIRQTLQQLVADLPRKPGTGRRHFLTCAFFPEQ